MVFHFVYYWDILFVSLAYSLEVFRRNCELGSANVDETCDDFHLIRKWVSDIITYLHYIRHTRSPVLLHCVKFVTGTALPAPRTPRPRTLSEKFVSDVTAHYFATRNMLCSNFAFLWILLYQTNNPFIKSKLLTRQFLIKKICLRSILYNSPSSFIKPWFTCFIILICSRCIFVSYSFRL